MRFFVSHALKEDNDATDRQLFEQTYVGRRTDKFLTGRDDCGNFDGLTDFAANLEG